MFIVSYEVVIVPYGENRKRRVSLSHFLGFLRINILRLVCPKGMWYTTAAFCRKTGNRSIREGTAKDGAIRRRPARDSLGHTSRLDRTRTGAAFLCTWVALATRKCCIGDDVMTREPQKSFIREEGFTLVELILGVVALGVLLLIIYNLVG